MLTLGQRNNNPLNIRRGKTPWKGETSQVLPLHGGDRGGLFCQFASPVWGIRAAFCLLRTYRNKYKAVCIEDIITRWAPPSENATGEYIRTVCKLTGFGGNERLTENEWPKLVQAMALVESRMALTPALLERSFELYRKS